MSRTVKGFVNHKMNNEVYKNKQKVLDFVYELKNQGLKLPYVRVKIGDAKKCTILAKAKMKKCEIWVTQKAIDNGKSELRNTIYHELLHAIYGCEHDEKCPIMCAIQVEGETVSKVKAIEIFKKYYNKYNN